MDENMIPNIDGEENTQEVAESISEQAEEVIEDIEDAAEDVAETVEDVAEDAVEAFEEVIPDFEQPKKSSKTGLIVGIVIAVLVVAGVVLAGIKFNWVQYLNPYNRLGYINVSGRTIQDVADEAGYESLSELLEEYGLPADMPANTTEAAAYYSIPFGKFAEMNGMDFETLKTSLGLGEDVTEETPWGEAESKITLEKYIGADYLDEFKEEYGLGDDVTGETLWGEVRNTIDKKTLADRKAQAKESANAPESEQAVPTEDMTEEVPEEVQTEETPVADDAEAAPAE